MARLNVDVLVDVKGADKLQKAGRDLTLFVTTPLLGAGVAMFKFASDAQESMSKAETVFVDASDEIVKASENMEDSFSQAQFLDIAGTFGSITDAMGFTKEESADLATNWISLAQDFASFNNLDTEDTLLAIRSAITGEFEPLKRMGIILNEAKVKQEALNLGLWDGTGALTDQAKALAINSLIMEGAGVQIGDYARTSEGAANSTRNLGANFSDLAAELGTNLLPIGTGLLQFLNSMVTAFTGLPAPVQQSVLVIGGLVAAIGPAILIGKSLIGSFQAVGAAFKVMSALFLANPFVLLAAAVIAIAALIFLNWDKIVVFLKGVVKGITQAFVKLADSLGGIWRNITRFASNAWNGLVGIIKGAINLVIRVINGFIGFINGIQIHIPAVGVGPVQTPRFDWNGLNIKKIPYLAEGGIVTQATLAVLGERSPEAVIPLDRLMQLVPNQINVYLTVEGDLTAKTPEEVVEAVQRATRFGFSAQLAGS